jgi:tRNA-dihydrouridine synthase 3
LSQSNQPLLSPFDNSLLQRRCAVCDKGMGAGLLRRWRKVREMIVGAPSVSSLPLTLKVRTGFEGAAEARDAHKFAGRVRLWSLAYHLQQHGSGSGGSEEEVLPLLSGLSIHGRTRQQRYSRAADWGYIRTVVGAAKGPLMLPASQLTAPEGLGVDAAAVQRLLSASSSSSFSCTPSAAALARAFDPSTPPADLVTLDAPLLPRIPNLVGNGDVLSHSEWASWAAEAGTATAMLARGALIKPWLPREIKEGMDLDLRSGERLELLKGFVNFGCVARRGACGGVAEKCLNEPQQQPQQQPALPPTLITRRHRTRRRPQAGALGLRPGGRQPHAPLPARVALLHAPLRPAGPA